MVGCLLAFCVEVKAIKVSIQTDVFYATTPAYVEILLFLGPEELYWKTVQDSLKQASVVWSLRLMKGNQTIKAEALYLNSPGMKKLQPFLYSLKWAVDTGHYVLESQFFLGEDQEPKHVYNNFTVRAKPSHSFLSSIQLLSGFRKDSSDIGLLTKSGYKYEPLPDATLYKDQYYLNFYYETYHFIIEQKFIIRYEIFRQDSNDQWQLIYDVMKQRTSRAVDPVFYSMDFSSCPSGLYRIRLSILQLDGTLVDSQSVYLNRENPFWDRIARLQKEKSKAFDFFHSLSNDTVDYSIRALTAVTPSQDFPLLQFFNREKKYLEKKLYLMDFFTARGKDPVETYLAYINIARKVDELYKSGFGYGFETDRGVIMMRYGVPDQIIKEDYDNGAFPYEIWKYDKLSPGAQTNVRFLFYNPDLAGSDFRLLHSTARGERFNQRWEYELYLNAKEEFKEADALGRNALQSNFNRRAREYFDN